MQIAVLSDLHLGPGGPTDRFGHDDAAFLRFFDRLARDFEQIVLLGDVYETLAPHAPGLRAQRAELLRCQAAHPLVAARLHGPRVRWIAGNHDLVAHRLGWAPLAWDLRVDGLRLHFTHGHILDPFSHGARRVSEWAFWLVGWLMRAGLGGLVRRLETLDELLSGANADPSRCAFLRAAAALAMEREVDLLVTGHTHRGGCFEVADRVVLNSGSSALGRREFLAIDTRARSWSLVVA
jgi:predicted phosphodiesterase